MKSVYKFFIPLFVLALLAVGVVGNVFAKNSSDLRGGSRETEVVGVVEAIAPDFWTIEGKVYQITPATEIKGVIQPGMRIKVHAYPGVNGALTAREIELADASIIPDNRSTNDAGRTDDLRNAGEREIYGTVESITATAWKIDGQVYRVTASTEIKGLIQPGARVKVHLIQSAEGALIIREVELAGVGASHNSRSEDNRSGDDQSSRNQSGNVRFDDKSNDKSHDGYDDNNRYGVDDHDSDDDDRGSDD